MAQHDKAKVHPYLGSLSRTSGATGIILYHNGMASPGNALRTAFEENVRSHGRGRGLTPHRVACLPPLFPSSPPPPPGPTLSLPRTCSRSARVQSEAREISFVSPFACRVTVCCPCCPAVASEEARRELGLLASDGLALGGGGLLGPPRAPEPLPRFALGKGRPDSAALGAGAAAGASSASDALRDAAAGASAAVALVSDAGGVKDGFLGFVGGGGLLGAALLVADAPPGGARDSPSRAGPAGDLASSACGRRLSAARTLASSPLAADDAGASSGFLADAVAAWREAADCSVSRRRWRASARMAPPSGFVGAAGRDGDGCAVERRPDLPCCSALDSSVPVRVGGTVASFGACVGVGAGAGAGAGGGGGGDGAAAVVVAVVVRGASAASELVEVERALAAPRGGGGRFTGGDCWPLSTER